MASTEHNDGAQLMTNIETRIEGSERLLGIFGYWPSFHDAEVIELHFWRGDANPDSGSYHLPILTVKLHVWEITNNVDDEGYFERVKHTLTTIRFHDVDEFKMEGFNHQNAILGLHIAEQQGSQGPAAVLSVNFRPAFGMMAEFTCLRIGLLDASPCTEDGVPKG